MGGNFNRKGLRARTHVYMLICTLLAVLHRLPLSTPTPFLVASRCRGGSSHRDSTAAITPTQRAEAAVDNPPAVVTSPRVPPASLHAGALALTGSGPPSTLQP